MKIIILNLLTFIINGFINPKIFIKKNCFNNKLSKIKNKIISLTDRNIKLMKQDYITSIKEIMNDDFDEECSTEWDYYNETFKKND